MNNFINLDTLTLTVKTNSNKGGLWYQDNFMIYSIVVLKYNSIILLDMSMCFPITRKVYIVSLKGLGSDFF